MTLPANPPHTRDLSPGPPRPGPGSITWRIHSERILILSWGRAILLQLAHPLVAAGVAQHSDFGPDIGRNRYRLHRTIQAALDLVFGPEAVAAATAARINAVHERVQGRLAEPTGLLPAGVPYAARMPELLLWVHATLQDSALRFYELYVGPLTPEEADRFCAESRAFGPPLGLPAELIPATRAALDAYITGMLTRGEIAVGETARLLARRMMQSPPAPWVRGPLLTALHLPTVGLLPPSLRAAYRFRWRPTHERALAVTSAACRHLLPLLPPAWRYWPVAHAVEAEAKIDRARPAAV